jgi:hypothetical protein
MGPITYIAAQEHVRDLLRHAEQSRAARPESRPSRRFSLRWFRRVPATTRAGAQQPRLRPGLPR